VEESLFDFAAFVLRHGEPASRSPMRSVLSGDCESE
jgi:hypothetical protein